MAFFRKKPVVVEAITFEEFVQHGLQAADANIVNGMPWSFQYKGHPVTHENDRCYLIPTLEGTHNFTPDDVLITGVKGEIYPCKIDIFKQTYEREDKGQNPKPAHQGSHPVTISLKAYPFKRDRQFIPAHPDNNGVMNKQYTDNGETCFAELDFGMLQKSIPDFENKSREEMMEIGLLILDAIYEIRLSN